jgi:predicted dehydrogenase
MSSKQPPIPDPDAAKDAANRRNFIKGSGLLLAGGAIVGPQLDISKRAHVGGTLEIKVGLIGCGDRGTAIALEALRAVPGACRLTAMADVFSDQLQRAYRTIKGSIPETDIGSEARFVGLEAYRALLNTDIDLVLLATPPGFRPLHFESAVNAGKHVFMEKPVATDSPGVRRVLASSVLASQKGLAVSVGLQRRYDPRYRECIARLQDGVLGEPIFARAYWNGAGVGVHPRSPVYSELEYQLRNWYYFNWLSGDHITEQHIHNLDVINWALKAHPIEAQGQGGREVRRGQDTGEIFDHHMVEYVYPGGVRLLSQCRHIPGCRNQVGEYVHGTKGWCDISAARIYDHTGGLMWCSSNHNATSRSSGRQQSELIQGLLTGSHPNETEYAAHSTLTAIMGRMATYSGKLVRWKDALNANMSLADVDSLQSLRDLAPTTPDELGNYPVPVPGKTSVTS